MQRGDRRAQGHTVDPAARTPGAAWRNDAIDVIASSGRPDWKRSSGFHRRSLAETLMYRLKVLIGNSLAARTIGAQATEVAIRAGLIKI